MNVAIVGTGYVGLVEKTVKLTPKKRRKLTP